MYINYNITDFYFLSLCILASRVMDFIGQITATTTASPVKLPPGLASMSTELTQVSSFIPLEHWQLI